AADLEHRLRQGIDDTQPAAPQMEEAFWRIVEGETGGVVAAAPRPIVMVPISEHARIMAGEGDDVILTLTDGTTMTGAEYLQHEFGETLEVAAFHPEQGAVNLYDTERFANQKQRDMACMVSPV
ncbi:HNH endonuclease, partial [Corynebacterium sp. MSK008]|nr:HNH endonuclease [Corynebacterium sp. MSK008]